MPARRGLSEREDRFALFVAQGRTQVAAAKMAGYKQAEAHASRLVVRGGVKEAIERYKAEYDALTPTPASVMAEAAYIARAHRDSNPSAAVQALRLQADILGALGGGKQDLSPEVNQLMEAIGRGAQQAAEAERRKQLTSVTVEPVDG